MPAKDPARYMRDYRAREKVIETPEAPTGVLGLEVVIDKDQIIADQTEEIGRLKRLLARRPLPELTTAISEGSGPVGRGLRQRGEPVDADSADRFNTRPFTPVPKTGKKK